MHLFKFEKTGSHNIFRVLGLKVSFLRSRARKAKKWLRRSIDPDKMTYYPQCNRKSKDEICKEIFELTFSGKGAYDHPTTTTQYFQFGCDRTGHDIRDYVFRQEYNTARNQLNGEIACVYKYKSIISTYLKAKGVNASCAIGEILPDGRTLQLQSGRVNFIEWLKEYQAPVFCKPNDGIQGQSCYKVAIENNQLVINGKISTYSSELGGLIVEPLIVQHQELRRISPHCVNPIRIRTINVNGTIQVISHYICIGSVTSYWSNGASCGVMIGLDADGNCITDAFCEVPGMEGRYQVIPGTDIAVKDIKIPCMREAIELAKEAHRATPQVYSLGWDIAITDNSPIVIEGNGDYGSGTYEAISGIGERELFERYFASKLHSAD